MEYNGNWFRQRLYGLGLSKQELRPIFCKRHNKWFPFSFSGRKMNKELDDEISKIMALTAEEFYQKVSVLDRVVEKVRTYQDFCKFTKLLDVMIVPICIELESDFSNSFDFTFGCFSDAINNYALPQNRAHFPPDYTEWTYLAVGLFRALATSG